MILFSVLYPTFNKNFVSNDLNLCARCECNTVYLFIDKWTVWHSPSETSFLHGSQNISDTMSCVGLQLRRVSSHLFPTKEMEKTKSKDRFICQHITWIKVCRLSQGVDASVSSPSSESLLRNPLHLAARNKHTFAALAIKAWTCSYLYPYYVVNFSIKLLKANFDSRIPHHTPLCLDLLT